MLSMPPPLRAGVATTAIPACAPTAGPTGLKRAATPASEMATVRKDIITKAQPEDVWDAIRDVGALHTRLVPGFVTHTRLEGGARVVTFASGMTVREPIVTLDEAARRLVWTIEGQHTTHYNGAVQVHAEPDGARVDFLPDQTRARIQAAMDAGCRAMEAALDRLAHASDE